ncbi:hypothetical protein ANME2D_00279 [Candidatus Methanoperedens nitroreducens]|uniref:Uncharacterized protein n=1 Tax=Candidatus Methanoperedens nitratireducens TaxID=1392998 RepID=A0A062VBY7_9EURY|nr:hypothetical protein [Candidatus Methanoperedens nitroreducens]KCZ73219.1 hypothetical protein ANME2D_00279 [Candidatus Methanoperedens nitroreducens]MDJ1422833.1 hypothetical protein [Candidatus Methanoperedens sp.]
MAGVTHSVDEVIEIDKLFNLLDIPVDGESSISDGDLSYNFYTISNLENEEKDILISIGFKEFKQSIFFIETKELRTIEVLQYLLPIYQKKEIEYWDEIIEKLVSINEKKIVFTPTSKQLRITSKWKGKLSQNEDEFRSLVSDLCLLFRDSCKKNNNTYKINEKCLSHEFWKIIGNLRNYYYSHDPEQWGEDAVKEFSEKAKLGYEYLFSSPTVKKSPIDFINAQFKLLVKCIDFLDAVSTDV